MWLASRSAAAGPAAWRSAFSASSGQVLGGVHVAHAVAPEQRDGPHPARVHGGGGGVGPDAVALDVGRHAQGHRAVVGQVLLEGDERLLQRLVEQQAAEAGAVHVEVALDRPVLLGDQARDSPLVALAVHDRVDHAAHPAGRHHLHQVVGQQGRVEVVRVRVLGVLVGQRGAGARGEGLVALPEQPAVQGVRRAQLVAQVGDDEAVAVEAVGPARAQPPLGKRVALHRGEALERVVEVVAGVAPVLEPDAQLVRRVAGRHPVPLLQPDVAEEVPDGAEGRLAHADAGDGARLHHGDLHLVAEARPQVGGGHPARRATARDHHMLSHCSGPPVGRSSGPRGRSAPRPRRRCPTGRPRTGPPGSPRP